MQSKISFFKSFRSFNPYILRKNIFRFAPLWGIYTVIWLFSLSSAVFLSGPAFAQYIAFTLQMMPVYNCIYAFCCAQLLFGDLFKTRMCYSLHALPMTREAWFSAHVLSGLLFSLAPNLLVALIILLGSGSVWTVAPLWLLAVTLQFLFFFGLATLSAYCSGKGFAMLLVYGLLNFLSWLVYAVLNRFYFSLLPGLILKSEPFSYFSPVMQMCMGELVAVEDIREGTRVVGATVTLGAGWGYLWICAAIGIVLLGLALLAYRKRHLESAGDFLAIRWLQPVFLVIYCFCCGLLFDGMFVGAGTVLMLFGLIIGWITGKMLLERTLRVFRKKSLIGCCILVLVMVGSTGLTRLDPLGITKWMPERSQIQSVGIDYYVDNASFTLSDEEAIAAALDIHQYGIDHPDHRGSMQSYAGSYVFLEYHLENGKTVQRRYLVSDKKLMQLRQHFSRMEYVLDTSDPEAHWASITSMTDGKGYMIAHQQGLYEALAQDAREGNLAQSYLFHEEDERVYTLSYSVGSSSDDYQIHNSITIYSSCTHTIAWLEASGFAIETPSKD